MDSPVIDLIILRLLNNEKSLPLTALTIGDLVTTDLPTDYTLLKNTTIEHSERLVTLETCYHRIFSDFRIIFRFSEIFRFS